MSKIEKAMKQDMRAFNKTKEDAGLGQPCFEYKGGMYIRPCFRGTVLTDHSDGVGIEDLLSDGDYHVEIKVWRP